jgi:hypothetical protein
VVVVVGGGGIDICIIFLDKAHKYSNVKHSRGPRAATLQKLIEGTARARQQHRTTIVILPELLDKARQYNICAPSGRGGLRSLHVYLEDCLIRDIREIEKRKEDLQKKL